MKFSVITEVFDRRYNRFANGLIWVICALEVLVFLGSLLLDGDLYFRVLIPLLILVPYALRDKEKSYIQYVPCKLTTNGKNLTLIMDNIIIDNQESYYRQHQFDVDLTSFSVVPDNGKIILHGSGYTQVVGNRSGQILYDTNFDNEVVELKFTDDSFMEVERYLSSVIPYFGPPFPASKENQ